MRISDWSSDVCSSDLLGKRRLRLHDLADHPAVFPDENTYTRRIVTQALQQHDLTPRIRLTTNYLETLKMLVRSEEHTSELQSLMRISYAVFCLKKKTNTKTDNNTHKKIHIP